MRRAKLASIGVLALVAITAGCGKKQSAPAGTASSTSVSAAPTAKWPGLLAAKEGMGWFDVTTAPSGQNGPLSGKTCAHWTLRFEGKTGDGKSRVSDDEWPHDAVALVVDGTNVDVPRLRIVWEVGPSITKTYAKTDADLPPKAREMLTSKTWMSTEGPLPAAVDATERCLAPATKYRAELRRTKSEPVEYDLAIAPSE
jgi:hypothetical protein